MHSFLKKICIFYCLLTKRDGAQYYVLMGRKDKKSKGYINKVLVLPLCDGAPKFVSKGFFDYLRALKKLPYKYVVFAFYTRTIYRNVVSCALIRQGRVVGLFGEGFSNRRGRFVLGRSKIDILLENDLYYKRPTCDDADYIIAFDDEPMQNEKYIWEKYGEKLLFFEQSDVPIEIKMHKRKISFKKTRNFVMKNKKILLK